MHEPSVTQQVRNGDYATLKGDQQFGGINAEAWRVMQGQPELKKMIGANASESEWAKSILAQVRNAEVAHGTDPGKAEATALTALHQHPGYKAFEELKNSLETKWVTANPQLALARWNADSSKPWNDASKWEPNAEQKKILNDYMAFKRQPVGAR